jgi:hypothetical protein
LGPDGDALVLALDHWPQFAEFLRANVSLPPDLVTSPISPSLVLIAQHWRAAVTFPPIQQSIADRKVAEAEANLKAALKTAAVARQGRG